MSSTAITIVVEPQSWNNHLLGWNSVLATHCNDKAMRHLLVHGFASQMDHILIFCV